jgi:hypothetical protein
MIGFNAANYPSGLGMGQVHDGADLGERGPGQACQRPSPLLVWGLLGVGPPLPCGPSQNGRLCVLGTWPLFSPDGDAVSPGCVCCGNA